MLNSLVLRWGAVREWLSNEVIIIMNGIRPFIKEIGLNRPVLPFPSVQASFLRHSICIFLYVRYPKRKKQNNPLPGTQ